jgi:hypothetical protein
MQLVSQRACIASGTAYQFFDDLECIYRDIYEEWYRDWWSVILTFTSELMSEHWEGQLRRLIEGSCNFLLKCLHNTTTLFESWTYVGIR